jgi:hypothetical protein
MSIISRRKGGNPGRFLPAALFLLLLALISMPLRPAQAQFCCPTDAELTSWGVCNCIGIQTADLLAQGTTTLAKLAQEIGIASNTVSIVTNIAEGITWLQSLFNDKIDKQTAVEATTKQLNAWIEYMIGQDALNQLLDVHNASNKTQVATQTAAHPDALMSACRDMHVSQSVIIIAGSGGTSLSEEMLSGIENRGRSIYDNFGGPMGASIAWASRCPSSSSGSNHANDPKTWNPIDNGPNGPPPECKNWVDSTGTFTDADLKATTLGHTLEKPKLVPVPAGPGVAPGAQTFQVSSSDPDSMKAQQFWVAADHYCYQVAGFRPTPSHKDNPLANDRIAKAQFDHCVALESAFVKQCTDMVDRHTRPNCDPSDPSFATDKPLCDASADLCLQAINKHIQFTSTNLPDFKCGQDGGTARLSPWQAEYLSHLLCTADDTHIGAAVGGASPSQLMGKSDFCNLSMANWKTQQANEENGFVNGMIALQDLRSCWAGTEGQPNPSISTPTVSNDGGASTAPEQTTPAKRASVKTKPPVRAESSLPVGIPVSADEASLPVVVAQ